MYIVILVHIGIQRLNNTNPIKTLWLQYTQRNATLAATRPKRFSPPLLILDHHQFVRKGLHAPQNQSGDESTGGFGCRR